MGLKEKCIRVLRSSDVQQVWFRVPSTPINVYAHQWSRLARCFENGHIEPAVRVGSEPGWAAYSSNDDFEGGDVIYFDTKQFFTTPFRDALFVHEMVHAMNDWNRISLSRADNEAAAYIAQNLYLLVRLGPDGGWIQDIEDYEVQTIFLIARSIAQQLLDHGRTLPASWSNVVTQLKVAIGNHPEYASVINHVTHYDGIGQRRPINLWQRPPYR